MTGSPDAAQRPGRRLRIILTGSGESDEQHIREILDGTFFQPLIETINTREALVARLAASAPDLVMAGEGHGTLDFPPVLEIARERAPRTPVIVFSLTPSEEAAV